MKEGLRVCFMGTPEFAVGSLAKIVESDHQIVGVVTAVDKPAGRGRKLQASEVKKFAAQHSLPIFQPSNLKSAEFEQQLKEMNPDVIVVVAFRMLPKSVWSFPRHGTFNLHASLLPKYRGAAPIHWAVINGEKETGVTTFFIDEKIDTGELILNKKARISPSENVGNVYQKLMHIGADLVIETLELIRARGKNVETKPQKINEGDLIPAAPKLNKDNTQVNWSNKSIDIFNLIRGLNPFPVAWTNLLWNDDKINVKLFRADYIITKHQNNPGKLHLEKGKLGVYTQDGILYIQELKAEGKKRMKVVDFLNGVNLQETAKFE